MTHPRVWFLLLAAVAVVPGGFGGPAGVPVTGTVKLGGAALPAAVVALEPEPGSGTTGAGAVVRVADGQFEIKAAQNLAPGKYVVRVSPVPLNVGDDLKTAPPQFRPWETKAEIGPDGPPLDLDVPDKPNNGRQTNQRTGR